MKKLILAVLVVMSLTGCSRDFIRSKVEEGIVKVLPSYIGPAEKYTVRANGSTSAMMNGLIERLHIEGEGVEVQPGLVVSHMTVDMDEVRYEPSTRQLTSVKNTVFEARISEAMANKLIESRQATNSDLKVEFQNGKVIVKLAPSLLGIDVPIAITGQLEITDHSKLGFVADKASVARLPVPAFAVNKVLEKKNPVLDLTDLRFPVRLNGVRVSEKSIYLKGSATIKPG